MNRSITSVAAIVIALVAGAPVQADRISDARKAYSFDLLSGWNRVEEDAFNYAGPKGELLMEMAAPTRLLSTGSLPQVSKSSAAMFGFEPTKKEPEHFQSAGWAGVMHTLVGRAGPKKVKSTLLILVVSEPSPVRTFWLIVEDGLLKKHEDDYVAILKSLQFNP